MADPGKVRVKRTTAAQRKLIRKLLANQKTPMSLREIADLVGCSHNTVHRISQNKIYKAKS